MHVISRTDSRAGFLYSPLPVVKATLPANGHNVLKGAIGEKKNMQYELFLASFAAILWHND